MAGPRTGPSQSKSTTAEPARPRRPRPPRIVVDVTKDIIDASEQRSSSHCMLAEAVRQTIEGCTGVAVDLQTIRFSDPVKGVRYVYLTPRRCQVALVMFDRGLHTDPFTFVLKGGQVAKMASPDPRPRPKGRGVASLPEGLRTELGAPLGNTVPPVVGGRMPPTGPLSNTRYAGQRRAFGLRRLDV